MGFSCITLSGLGLTLSLGSFLEPEDLSLRIKIDD